MLATLAARLRSRRTRWGLCAVAAAAIVLVATAAWALRPAGGAPSARAGTVSASADPEWTPGDAAGSPSASASASAAASPSAAASAGPGARSTTPAAPGRAGSPGAVKPGPGNTGVPVGTRLTRHDGDLTVTTPGATFDALDIHGFVTIKAPNVKITRSIIRGGRATANTGLIKNTDVNATNLVVEDSELVPEFPSVRVDGIIGFNYTIRRVNVHGTVDTAKVFGNDVRIESSWLHDTVQYAHDPNQSNGPTHNDGVQVLSGRNIRIIGNTITGSRNAAMQVTQDHGVTTDLVFSRNWADNGNCSVNLAHGPLTTMAGLTVSGNRFGRNTGISDCAVLATGATSVVTDGNVWEDNGTPVRIRRYG